MHNNFDDFDANITPEELFDNEQMIFPEDIEDDFPTELDYLGRNEWSWTNEFIPDDNDD